MRRSRADLVEVGVPYLAWPLRYRGEYDLGYQDGMLSEALQQRIRAWSDFLSREFDEVRGWANDEAADRYAGEGEAIAAAVSSELGPTYVVRLVDFPPASMRPSVR